MKQLLPIFTWFSMLPLAGWDFVQNQWECMLVLFAALTLVPKGLALLGLPQDNRYWIIALCFGAAYLLDTPGVGISDALALPYLVLSVWLTLREATALLTVDRIHIQDMLRVFALGYWATGAFWSICFLSGFQPLGFDPVIVSLTAAHFHVAGFVVAVVAWCLLMDDYSLVNRAVAWGALAGMPLVALGITLSKLGFPTWIETFSAIGFVALALTVVVQLIRLFDSKRHPATARRLWLAGAICLLAGGSLAALYGLRFQVPIEFVSIPNMKIWHGTLNALGFGWFTLSGWER